MIRFKGQLCDLFSFEPGKQKNDYKSRNHAMQRMWNKISYNPGTQPTLDHAISIVSNLKCFRVMISRKMLLLNFAGFFVSAKELKERGFKSFKLLVSNWLHALGSSDFEITCTITCTPWIVHCTPFGPVTISNYYSYHLRSVKWITWKCYCVSYWSKFMAMKCSAK